MKPALLLDTHLAGALALALTARGFDVALVKNWRDEDFRNASDATILAAALEAGRVVVTRDARTFPALANGWVAEGRSHAGVIVLSARINNRDIGRQLQSIVYAVDEIGDDSWSGRVVYAHR